MNEIDFLPKWYKNDRRQQFSYRTQYIVLGTIFVAMLMCNLVTTRSISKAEAELAEGEPRVTAAKNVSQEFARIKSEIVELQQKAKYVEAIDSRIDVASVLAEISFLIDKKVVLSKVEFIAEKFSDRQLVAANNSSVVRIAGSSAGKKDFPFGNVRFRAVLSGVASDSRDVAELICRLEDSPYFCQVIPSFSKNKKIKAHGSASGKELQVSEFEISCYLANYLLQSAGFIE